MSKKRSPLFALLLSLLLAACSSSNSGDGLQPPSAKEVMEYYELYRSGNYAEYVKAMQSCDDKPADFCKQMADALKQHAARIKAEKGGTVSAEFLRTELHAEHSAADAYLSVTYGDSTKEEIILPFVFCQDKWRLK